MKKLLPLVVISLALVACEPADEKHPLDIPPEVELEQPEQPIIYPVYPVEQPLIAPQLQGTVMTTQEWSSPVAGHPQASIKLTFYVDWTGNADGYDILVDGKWVASTTVTTHYSFTQQVIGQIIYADIPSLLPEVRVRAWRNTDDEVLSEPVNWVY